MHSVRPDEYAAMGDYDSPPEPRLQCAIDKHPNALQPWSASISVGNWMGSVRPFVQFQAGRWTLSIGWVAV